MAPSISKDKTRDVRKEASTRMDKREGTLSASVAFIGKALTMIASALPARLKTQELTQLKNEAPRHRHSRAASVSVRENLKRISIGENQLRRMEQSHVKQRLGDGPCEPLLLRSDSNQHIS
ncbi:hypothetical protein BX616_005189 [Lobosporangium transversale]|nr:hypothetical protein BX616_005189 [Lobosporangium transversale]